METFETPLKKRRPLTKWLFVSVGVLLVVLSLWTWQKWQTVWIEPSEAFFPPEWQRADFEILAWRSLVGLPLVVALLLWSDGAAAW